MVFSGASVQVYALPTTSLHTPSRAKAGFTTLCPRQPANVLTSLYLCVYCKALDSRQDKWVQDNSGKSFTLRTVFMIPSILSLSLILLVQ